MLGFGGPDAVKFSHGYVRACFGDPPEGLVVVGDSGCWYNGSQASTRPRRGTFGPCDSCSRPGVPANLLAVVVCMLSAGNGWVW